MKICNVRLRLISAAIICAASLCIAKTSHATTLTWDASGSNPGAPTDGSGNWDATAAANWSNGAADSVWDNASTAQFGSNNGAAGTVTIDDVSGTVSVAGINFNPAGSGNYTIAASGANTLTLTSPTVTVAPTASPTISASIAGSAGLTMSGNGTLTLTGANAYSGGTVVSGGTTGGTLNVNAGGTLGAAASTLTMGAVGGSLTDTTPVIVNLNNSQTVGGLTVNVNNATSSPGPATVDVLTIASGQTVTVNGAASIGLGSASSATNTVLNSYSGAFSSGNSGTGGELDVNGNFTVGLANTNATSTKNATVVDLSALSKFTITSTSSGVLNIGNGANTQGKLTLASGTNSVNIINVNTMTVGASGSSNANAGCLLTLGSGSNTLEAGAINIGTGKSSGVVQFISGAPATASVSIGGLNGSGTADITIGRQTSGTATGNTSSMSFFGHPATVQAGTVVVGALAGATGGTVGATAGSISFDTGNFTVATSLQICVDSSGNDAAGIGGLFTVGGASPNNTATGTLDVSGNFILGNVTSTSTSTKTDTAKLIINGGTVSSHVDISSVKVSGALTRPLLRPLVSWVAH